MDDMLSSIEYLRQKANVTYEEAVELLERYEGNVMRALVELEQQGRVYPQGSAEKAETDSQHAQRHVNEAKEKTASFLQKAFENRLVVERKNDSGEKELVANVSMPFAVGVAVFAPYLAVATAAVAFATGHNVNIRKEKKDEQQN